MHKSDQRNWFICDCSIWQHPSTNPVQPISSVDSSTVLKQCPISSPSSGLDLESFALSQPGPSTSSLSMEALDNENDNVTEFPVSTSTSVSALDIESYISLTQSSSTLTTTVSNLSQPTSLSTSTNNALDTENDQMQSPSSLTTNFEVNPTYDQPLTVRVHRMQIKKDLLQFFCQTKVSSFIYVHIFVKLLKK